MVKTFVVVGNQKDKTGNPLAYRRINYNSKWTPYSQEYVQWKLYVLQNFYEQSGLHFKFCRPFVGTPRGKVSVLIDFKDERHPDSDNVVKGILDSLFENDKEIDVETKHQCKQPEGKLTVTIELYE